MSMKNIIQLRVCVTPNLYKFPNLLSTFGQRVCGYRRREQTATTAAPSSAGGSVEKNNKSEKDEGGKTRRSTGRRRLRFGT